MGNKGANKGQTRSLEMRKTFGIKHIGNKYSLGRIDSIHTKEKQKISHIGNNNALGKGKKIIQKDLAGNIIQIGTINTYPKIFKPSGIYMRVVIIKLKNIRILFGNIILHAKSFSIG